MDQSGSINYLGDLYSYQGGGDRHRSSAFNFVFENAIAQNPLLRFILIAQRFKSTNPNVNDTGSDLVEDYFSIRLTYSERSSLKILNSARWPSRSVDKR
jgi:hypothetical protein